MQQDSSNTQQQTESNTEKETELLYHLQLFPHSDVNIHSSLSRFHKFFVFKPIEMDISSGMTVKIGRKIDAKKEGSSMKLSREEHVANNASLQPLQGNSAFPDEDSSQVELGSCKSELISFRSKVVSRSHGEIWLGKDGQVYFKDVGSSSGTFLNRLRLSPTGKESRPYPLKSGDVIQLGVDYQGRQEEIYKCVVFRIFISATNGHKPKPKSQKLKTALNHLIGAMNPYSDESYQPDTACCICLSDMEPFQALFLAPCSHCFHYKCCTPLLELGFMFQCPLCRQVANLEADVTTKCELEEEEEEIEEELQEKENVLESKTISRPCPSSSSSSIPIPTPTSGYNSNTDMDTPHATPYSPPTIDHARIPISIPTSTATSNSRVELVDQEEEILALSRLRVQDESLNRDGMQQVLSEYESAVERLVQVFPGLQDDTWRSRIQNVRNGLL